MNFSSLWQSQRFRSLFFQGLFGVLILSFFGMIFINAQSNLRQQNISSGFGFLSQVAGFEISESLISYESSHSYLRALTVGFLNTLQIAFLGNLLAILLGVLVGILSLSKNFLVSLLARSYVEFFRNIPLLLQLFFWYSLFNEILPGVKVAYSPLAGVFFSNRGIFFPWSDSLLWKAILGSVLLALILGYGIYRFSLKRLYETGKTFPTLRVTLLLILIFPFLTWFLGGASISWEVPALQGFNFVGGGQLSPEFMSLLLGLVLYTGAFNGEVVRSGIQSISKGQWEAGEALGLSRFRILLLLVLPQALRVIIPPLTSQILNLTKNSSLAVAIAYPDFVSLANTTLNQTGQAIELVASIMLVYLTLSLLTSLFMNWYNQSVHLVER